MKNNDKISKLTSLWGFPNEKLGRAIRCIFFAEKLSNI